MRFDVKAYHLTIIFFIELTNIPPKAIMNTSHNSTSLLFSSNSLIYLWSVSTWIGQSLNATSAPPRIVQGSISDVATLVNFPLPLRLHQQSGKGLTTDEGRNETLPPFFSPH